MFTANGVATVFKTKRETKRELAEKANRDINDIIVNYMEKEKINLLETLSLHGIVGDKAESVLNNLKIELQAKLMIEASKNIREFKEAANRGDFSWMSEEDRAELENARRQDPSVISVKGSSI